MNALQNIKKKLPSLRTRPTIQSYTGLLESPANAQLFCL